VKVLADGAYWGDAEFEVLELSAKVLEEVAFAVWRELNEFDFTVAVAFGSPFAEFGNEVSDCTMGLRGGGGQFRIQRQSLRLENVHRRPAAYHPRIW